MAPRLLRDLSYALRCRSVVGILLLGVTFHSASCGGGAGVPPSQPAAGPYGEPEPAALKPWALLLYDDARFDGYDPLYDFANAVASSPNLHVVVLRGTLDEPTYAWYVDEHQSVLRLRGFNAFDTGHPHTFAMSDPDTFETFAHYVQAAFPAERYVVAYYDHGGGWTGCCVDVTAGPTAKLSMHAIRTGLAALGHVDAVLFTAPCLMGAVESAYELRDVADVYVGSEQTSGFVYWNGAPLVWIRNALSDTPDVSAVDLAGGAVRAIEQNASSIPQYAGPLTMSAIRLAQVSGVRLAVDDLVKALRSDAGAENDLDAVAADVQKYGDSSIVDLFDLTRRLAATSRNRAVRARARRESRLPSRGP
jgi:cysteine peptidase C11 family protein